MADNELDIILRLVTGGFDAAVNKSKSTIKTFSTEAERELKKTEKAIEGVEKAGHKLNGVFGAMVEAYAGGKIIEFMKSFVEAAAGEEARMVALSTAMVNMGDAAGKGGKSIGESAEALEKYGKALALASGYGLEQITQGMTNFINEGMSTAQVMYMTGLAADIAAAKHINLATTQQILSRAISTGSAASLARLGIHLKGVNLATAGLDDVLGKLAGTFGGQAAAHAKTFEGAMGRLNVEIEMLKEGFGKDLIGALTGVIGKINDIADVFRALSPEARRIIEVVAIAVGVFMSLALVLPLVVSICEAAVTAFAALAPVIAALSGPIGWIILGLGSLVAAIVAVTTHWEGFKKGAHDALQWTLDRIKEFVGFVRSQFDAMGGVLHGAWRMLTGDKAGWDEMKASAEKGGQALIGAFKSTKAGIEIANKAVLDAAHRSGDAIKKYVGAVFHMGKIEHPGMPKAANPGGFDEFNKRRKGKGAKKAKDTAGHAESDRIKDLRAAIEQNLGNAKDAIDDVKMALDKLDDAEERVKASIGEQGATWQQQQRLLEINAQRQHEHIALSHRYAAEAKVEAESVRLLGAERARLAGNKKMHAQYIELTNLIRTHTRAIATDKFEQQKADTTAIKNLVERKRLESEYEAKQRERLKVAQELQRSEIEGKNAHDKGTREVAAASRKFTTAVDTAGDHLANTKADAALASAALRAAYELMNLSIGTKEEAQARKDFAAAGRAAEAADNAATIALIDFTKAVDKVHQGALQQLGEKIGQSVPEIAAFTNALQNGGNPLVAVFLAIAQRTKSFHEIVQILSNIFTVIARVLDAIFLPIIRTLSRVLTSVVNVFIGLWNIIADVVGVFGIHIQKLKYINSLLGDLSANARPLLDVVHDLPTSKEYGAGKWGALQPDQYGNANNLPSLIQDQTQKQSGWFGDLIKAGVALLAIEFLTHGHFLAGLANWFPQLGSWLKQGWDALSGVFHSVGNALQGKLGGLVEMGAGIALLSTHSKGMLGLLEKILGAILVLQGITQVMGGGGGFLGLFSKAGAAGAGPGGAAGGLGSSGLSTAVLGTPGGNGVLGGSNGLLGGTLNTSFGASTIGKTVAPVAAGMIVGAVLGQLQGGGSHTTWGEIGGAAGGAIGSFFGGPLGGYIGGALGGAVGSLFGKAAPNEHDNPDIAGDTAAYGQGMANLGGNGGKDWSQAYVAGDQSYTEDAQVSSMLNGHGEESFIKDYISKTGGKGLDQSLIDEFKNSNGVTYKAGGNVDIGGGVSKYWKDMVGDAKAAISQIALQVGNDQQTAMDANGGAGGSGAPTDLATLSAMVGKAAGGLGNTSAFDGVTNSTISELTMRLKELTTALGGKTADFVARVADAGSSVVSTAVDAVSSGVAAVTANANKVAVAPSFTTPNRTPGPPEGSGGSVTSITQNNTHVGDVNGGDLVAIDASIARRAQIMHRTSRYAS